jgi:hypothetical protein
MNILGLSLGILSTAALSRGNKIIACASEESSSGILKTVKLLLKRM